MDRDGQIIFQGTVVDPGNQWLHQSWYNTPSLLPLPCEPICQQPDKFVFLWNKHPKGKIELILIALLTLQEIESKHIVHSFKVFEEGTKIC